MRFCKTCNAPVRPSAPDGDIRYDPPFNMNTGANYAAGFRAGALAMRERMVKWHESMAASCYDKIQYSNNHDSPWTKGWRKQGDYHASSAEALKAIDPATLKGE